MYDAWTFHSAGKLVFGNGAVRRLPQILKRISKKKVVLITDAGIKRAGILDEVLGVLRDDDFDPMVFDQAETEPTIRSVEDCLSEVSAWQPDQFIALGGGSCIDLAKITSLLFTYGGRPADYYGEGRVPGLVTPVIAVPTTSGSGSEVSPVAIVTDEDTGLKSGISDNLLRPTITLYDPVLTLRLPTYITACTGIDALSQAIEAYFAKSYCYVKTEEQPVYQGANPISDVFAEKAIPLIHRNLRIAVLQSDNLEARSQMMLGSLLSALAFTNSGTSLIHALAYPVAEKTHAVHGAIVGALLPYVMKYNGIASPDKFRKLAELLDESSSGTVNECVDRSVSAIVQLLSDIGLKGSVLDLGVDINQVDEMIDTALSIERLIRLNPRQPKARDLKAVLLSGIGRDNGVLARQGAGE